MKLTMHKCRICGAIFWHGCKNTYCTKCIPCVARDDIKKRYVALNYALARESNNKRYIALNDALLREKARAEDYLLKDNPGYIEARRKRDRERWHKRMENPAFRERERLRSLERAKRHRMEASNGN